MPALKLPSASVRSVTLRPSVDVITTSASGITAPEISMTVPVVLAVCGGGTAGAATV